MKLIIKILFIGLFASCANQTNQNEEFERLIIWEDIQNAIKENRISFLLDISKDTLECIECNDGKNRISKEEFFSEHIKQIKQPNNKKYSIQIEDIEDESGFNKRYRINYKEKFKGNNYNTIYTVLEKENKIQFQGVFGIP